MKEAIRRARSEIINNVYAGSTKDAVQDLSMPIPMSELFDEKKIRMTGIEHKDKDWEEDKIKRAMREEITKSVRDKLCTTLQHRSEAIRKDHKCLTRD